MKRFFFALALLTAACSGTSESSTETFDELNVAARETKPDVARGKLERGERGGLAIAVAQGPEDHEVIALDLSKTELARDEDALLAAARDREIYVRGTIERRDTGETVHGSRIERDVFVVSMIGAVESNDTSSTGILREREGAHVVEKSAGAGADSDDAGSIVADFEEVSLDVARLVDKKVRARGTKILAYEGAVHGHTIARERIVVRSIARAR